MKPVRLLLSIGMTGALLFPGMTMALDAASETDAFGTFIMPADTGDGTSAAFDIQALTAHPCYHAIGQEQEYCLRLFGVTTDPSSETGEIGSDGFRHMIIEEALEQRCDGLLGNDELACRTRNNALLPDLLRQLESSGTGSVLSDTDDDTMEDDDGTTLQEDRRTRMTRLWDLCAGHNLTQAGCYQNFIGIIDRASMDEIEELFDGNGNANDALQQEQQEEQRADRATRRASDRNQEDGTEDENNDENDVRSETAEDVRSATVDDRAGWLWDMCADAARGRAICYRDNYRAATMEDTDLVELERVIRGE